MIIKTKIGYKNILRGGAVVARRAHNPKVISSSLVPATKESQTLSARHSIEYKNILRGGAVVARRAHNPKVISSSLVPATK